MLENLEVAEVNDSPESEIIDQPDVEGIQEQDQVEDENSAEGVAETTPEYQSNLTYSIGKDQKQFPEFLHSVVTSKEVEEQVRDLLTKADGLPVLKEKLSEVVEQNNDFKEKWEYLGYLRDTNPVKFFEATNISKDTVMKVLSDDDLVQEYNRRKEFRDLPVHAQNQIKERDEYLVRERNYQRQFADFQQRENQLVIQQFDFALQQPQVQTVQQAYDSVYGEGAFRREAGQYGDYVSRQRGHTVSPQEVIDYMVQRAKPVADMYANKQPVSESPTQKFQQPATIPSVGKGGAQSPGKPRVTSVADIENLYKQKYGTGN